MSDSYIQPDHHPLATIEASPDKAEMEGEKQRVGPDLQPVIAYLENDILPEDDRKAQELILGRAQYTMVDRVLYRVELDKTLRVEVPVSLEPVQ